jgi:hypothetical protein
MSNQITAENRIAELDARIDELKRQLEEDEFETLKFEHLCDWFSENEGVCVTAEELHAALRKDGVLAGWPLEPMLGILANMGGIVTYINVENNRVFVAPLQGECDE